MHLGKLNKEQFETFSAMAKSYLKKKRLTEQEKAKVEDLRDFLCPDAPGRNVAFRHPSST